MSDTDTNEAEVQQVNGEVQQQEVQERPHISLEARLGAVLGSSGRTSSDELKQLIAEAEREANKAEAAAKRLHAEALDFACTDASAVEQQALAQDLMVARLDAALPRLDDLLRKEVADDYARRWRVRRDRALTARETVAKRLASYREMAAQLVNIFQEVQYLDSHIIEPVNQARPAGEPAITTCELYARKLDAFSRSMPSIISTTQLPDWSDSQRNVWPPKPVPMGVLVAESMAPASYHPGDRWYEQQNERRAAIDADSQIMTDYYQRVERERQEREDKEAALAAAERQRQGYP
jgi:hypothetical protein